MNGSHLVQMNKNQRKTRLYSKHTAKSEETKSTYRFDETCWTKKKIEICYSHLIFFKHGVSGKVQVSDVHKLAR